MRIIVNVYAHTVNELNEFSVIFNSFDIRK